MGNKYLSTILFVVALLTSACKTQTVPVVPTPGSPTEDPKPSPTAPPGPSTIGGEFILSNTSVPGMEVGIETMNILLEYRLSVQDPWKKIEANCSFDPPAPAVLKDKLPVQYKCQYEYPLPADAEMRVTAEVQIFGNNEIFRLVVEPH